MNDELGKLKSTSWGLFTLAVLVWLWAMVAGSGLLTVISNFFFLIALIVVGIYYGKQRKLGYLSLAIGILGLLALVGGQLILAFLFIGFGIVCALIDAIQRKRWIFIGLVAALVLVPAVIVALLFSAAIRGMTSPGSSSTAPVVEKPSPEPNELAEEDPEKQDDEVAETEGISEEELRAMINEDIGKSEVMREAVREAAELANDRRLEPEPASPPQPIAISRSRPSPEGQNFVFVRSSRQDFPGEEGGLYHIEGCAEIEEGMIRVSRTVAKMQRAKPHECVTD